MKEPGIFERLKAEAKAGSLPEQDDKFLHLAFYRTSPIIADDKDYGWKILADVYKMLNISSVVKKSDTRMKADIYKALQLMVYQRILQAGSKLFTVASQEKLWGSWDIKEHQLYRSLDVLEALKEDIQMAMHHSIKESIGRTASVYVALFLITCFDIISKLSPLHEQFFMGLFSLLPSS